MNVFFIAHINFKDAEKFQQYAAVAGPSMKSYNGELLCKGKSLKPLCGNSDYEMVVIVNFPSQEHARNWYASQEYQSVIPVRDEAVDINIELYETSN